MKQQNKMTIAFKDVEHITFFVRNVGITGSERDTYRKAFFYTFGILQETRDHIYSFYDFEVNCPKVGGFAEAWQTKRTLRLCRLAFNLYNGFNHNGTTWNNIKPDTENNYTPYELFATPDAFFMLEAIKIRYPEYTKCDDVRLIYKHTE